MPVPKGTGKPDLRRRLLAARRQRPAAQIAEDARSVADRLLSAPEVRAAAAVAAYVSVGSEPGTGPFLESLLATGRRVIVPVLLPDLDLDWAVYHGPDGLARAGRGLLEPEGPTLGTGAIATADAVVVPGLAVDDAGVRLGRGGGSYDRALARVPVGTFTCVVVEDDAVGLAVPVDAHDRAVTAAVTPTRLVRFGSAE